MGLRKGQKELVENYRGGFCAVPAIPGGGKTHSLSLWAVEMITQNLHKPGKILIVTYMNSAVNNFKQRIGRELENRGIKNNRDYFVSTIHGLCLQIIKDRPNARLSSEDFNIVDEITRINFIEAGVTEWRRYNKEIFQSFVEEALLTSNSVQQTLKSWQDRFMQVMLNTISEFKTRGISPKEAKELSKSLKPNSLLRCGAELYEAYDLRLKLHGLIDFDDMLYHAKIILSQDESLLKSYRKRFSFVLEDEAQDSNRIQSEILSLIANGNLLRVGDSNQAICGSFSNSDFKYFKEFCRLPETKVYQITQSSRNTKEIIELANFFVAFVRERHPVIECRESLLPQYIEPVPPEDERPNPVLSEEGIKTRIFKSWEEEAFNVILEAERFIRNHPDKTVAVLVPYAWKMKEMVALLEKRKIPFEQLENSAGDRNKVTHRIGRILDYIEHPEDGKKLAMLMNECLLSEMLDETQTEMIDGIEVIKKSTQDDFTRFLGAYPVEKLLYPVHGSIIDQEIPEGLKNSKIWIEFIKKLPSVKKIVETPTGVIEKLILSISDELNFNREERAIAQKIAGDVRFILAQNPHWSLSDFASILMEPRNMFSYFNGLIWDLKGYEPKPGKITLSTYHKSKGLEWDAVFLTSLNNSDFPVRLEDKFMGEYWFLKKEYKNPQAIAKSELLKILEQKEEVDSILESKVETISEKARLLYVGMTRAKERLFLSGFHSNPGKKNESTPSQYFLELKKFLEGRKGEA